MCDRAGRDAANSVGADGNGRCILDVSADAAADGHQERTKWQRRSLLGGKLTRSQVGWLDLLFRGMVSIPVDCTPEEACRLISARTDDRSFVALLNEAMAVVLPGEPLPRAKADRVRMLVDAVHQG